MYMNMLYMYIIYSFVIFFFGVPRRRGRSDRGGTTVVPRGGRCRKLEIALLRQQEAVGQLKRARGVTVSRGWRKRGYHVRDRVRARVCVGPCVRMKMCGTPGRKERPA